MFYRSLISSETAHRNKNCIGNKTFISLKAVNFLPDLIMNSVTTDPVDFYAAALLCVAVVLLALCFVIGRPLVLTSAKRLAILTEKPSGFP